MRVLFPHEYPTILGGWLIQQSFHTLGIVLGKTHFSCDRDAQITAASNLLLSDINEIWR